MKKTAWGKWPLGRTWGCFELHGLRVFHGTGCKHKSISRIFSKLAVSKKQQTMRKAVLSGTLGRGQVTPIEFMTRKVIWIGFHSAKGMRMVDVLFVNKEDCTKIDDSFLSPNKKERAGVEYWPKVVRLFFMFVSPVSLQHSINFFTLLKHKQTFCFSKLYKKRVNLAANNRSVARTDMKREWKSLKIYSKRSWREKCKYSSLDTPLLFSFQKF